MRIFVLRARKGPTLPDYVEANLGQHNHLEVIAQTIIAAFYVAKDLRDDVILHIVCEGPPEPPKIITLDSRPGFPLSGFDEGSTIAFLKQALARSAAMERHEIRCLGPGLQISRKSFENLARELSATHPTFILDKKGTDIRQSQLSGDACFLLTDHIPMQKKTGHLLRRLGVKKLSLGPRMVFAAHCVAITHNELDRRHM